MQRIVFWLVYPLLWLISILPFPVFYKVSDGIFVVVYYLVGYRRKTVTENLRLVFPEKSTAQIRAIRKKFYRHMVDMFLEMVKSISISDEQLKKRFAITNLEELKKARAMEKSVILACGHYASYEWMNAIQLYDVNYRGFGVYKKVKNKYFDKLAKDIRQRYNGELIATTKATKTISANQQKGILGVYAMIADQSPRLNRARTWMPFMGVEVPVFTGTEKLSKDLDMVVLYLQVVKLKRGYYRATFVPITFTPRKEPEHFITKTYFRELEAQIRAAPEYYLWTHKRWKHRNASIPPDSTVIKQD